MKEDDATIAWMLSLEKCMKLDFIDTALKDGNFTMALRVATVYLDAPIHKGGIATEEIDRIFKRYLQDPNY